MNKYNKFSHNRENKFRTLMSEQRVWKTAALRGICDFFLLLQLQSNFGKASVKQKTVKFRHPKGRFCRKALLILVIQVQGAVVAYRCNIPVIGAPWCSPHGGPFFCFHSWIWLHSGQNGERKHQCKLNRISWRTMHKDKIYKKAMCLQIHSSF